MLLPLSIGAMPCKNVQDPQLVGVADKGLKQNTTISPLINGMRASENSLGGWILYRLLFSRSVRSLVVNFPHPPSTLKPKGTNVDTSGRSMFWGILIAIFVFVVFVVVVAMSHSLLLPALGLRGCVLRATLNAWTTVTSCRIMWPIHGGPCKMSASISGLMLPLEPEPRALFGSLGGRVRICRTGGRGKAFGAVFFSLLLC